MSDYAELKARLSIKADMIQLGEKIEWGSDSAIMREAAAAIEALSAVTPGVKVGIDEMAYRFWSIHPKDIPEPVGMPEGYKGGPRAWFFATEMRKMIAALAAMEGKV